MPVVKTVKEGNVTTEIVDMTGGKGHLSTDEILARTGGQAGQHMEVGPDGKTYTYSVEVEEVCGYTMSWKTEKIVILGHNVLFCLKGYIKSIYFEIFLNGAEWEIFLSIKLLILVLEAIVQPPKNRFQITLFSEF